MSFVIVSSSGYRRRHPPRGAEKWTFRHADRGVWHRKAAAMRELETLGPWAVIMDDDDTARSEVEAWAAAVAKAVTLRDRWHRAWLSMQAFDIRGVDTDEAVDGDGRRHTITRAQARAELDAASAAMLAETNDKVRRFL